MEATFLGSLLSINHECNSEAQRRQLSSRCTAGFVYVPTETSAAVQADTAPFTWVALRILIGFMSTLCFQLFILLLGWNSSDGQTDVGLYVKSL